MTSVPPTDLPLLLRANWVAPMDEAASNGLVNDGGVVMRGPTIAAVGGYVALRREFPAAIVQDCGRAVILPGLVNAHTHLELSALSQGSPPARFVDWVLRLIQQTALAAGSSPAASVAEAVSIGISQCLRFGVTAVGDISRLCQWARPLLQTSPLRVVSYGEVTAMAQRRGLLHDRLAQAADDSYAGTTLKIGVSPHAPYSVEPEGYRQCLRTAHEKGLPLATHLAETADECEFLSDHAGPLRELWDRLGGWDEAVPRFTGGPIRLMHSLGLLDRSTSLAHVNYCDDDELALLARSGSGTNVPSVVYCPRTHAYFGHPPHRWRDMLARGVNVAVGTDSCASSPNLNLVDDLRLLRRLAPDVPALVLWGMATIRAAKAIGMEDRIGSLSPGKAADCAIFAVQGNDPLCELLEAEVEPTQVWIGGKNSGKADPRS